MNSDAIKTQHAQLLTLLGIVACLFNALVGEHPLTRWSCGVTATVLAALLAVFRQGGMSVRMLAHLALTTSWIHLCLNAWIEGGIFSSKNSWMLVLVVTQFYIVGVRAGIFWMLLVLLTFVLQAMLAQGLLLAWMPPGELHQALMSLSDYSFSAVALFIVAVIYQRLCEHGFSLSRQRQHELQAQQVALEHTLQMREHFIASVSHELRTPMNAILGLNTVLLGRVQDKPQARKVLEYTRQSADHLMTVINDVLDYSQFSTGQIHARVERFALRETVRAAFEMFQPKVESTRLRYTCDIAADVPEWVQTDRHRLMQVLVNLLGNAIKFTHQGRVLLQVSVKDGGVEFSVQDTGIGIAPEQQQRIFERFGQADASIQGRYGGSGLGLAISQRLVKMLGGQLQLESHEGAGSRFWFRLPLQPVQPPQAAAPEHGQLQATEPKTLRFLVVDDHPVNRLLVHQVLLRHWPQAEVVQVQDGAQALRALEEGQPFDLVLMDMVMPVMDGIEATAAIRASAQATVRQTPVLGLTANVSVEDLRRFEQAGLNGLLLKPFEVDRLRTEVQRLNRSARVQEGQT